MPLDLVRGGQERLVLARDEATSPRPARRQERGDDGSRRRRGAERCSSSKAAGLAGMKQARLQMVVEVGNGRGDGEDLSDEAGLGLVVGASMAAPGYLR